MIETTEKDYWKLIIKFLTGKKKTFAIHRAHKTSLMNDPEHQKWINHFERENSIIPTHSKKISMTIPDFLVLEPSEFSSSYYLYSYEIKGEVNKNEFLRGMFQAELAKDGVDVSVLVLPMDSVKAGYMDELNKKGILLGKMTNDGQLLIQDKTRARTSFDPFLHNHILQFLLVINQKRSNEIISKIKSSKTIVLHYIIPGFVRYLYKKYENRNLSEKEIESILHTHWMHLNAKTSWTTSKIREFIRSARQYGYFTKTDLFYNLIELYLKTVVVHEIYHFPEISNMEIKNNIQRLFGCAISMKGKGKWLFDNHKMLADIVLDRLSSRPDMKIVNSWMRELQAQKKNPLHGDYNGFNFRDMVDYFLKKDVDITREFFFKTRVDDRKVKDDICLQQCKSKNLSCPKGTNVDCFGFRVTSYEEMMEYCKEVVEGCFGTTNESSENYEDIPARYHDDNDKKKPVRFGFVKAMVDSNVIYNFKRNLIHLGYFSRNIVFNNEFLKKNNYPIGNDTSLGYYCPYLDVWDVDESNDAIQF